MKNPFKRNTAPVDPVERLCKAVDECNAAIAALPRTQGRLRLYTLPANRTTGLAPKLVVGFWSSAEQGRFEIVYEGV